MSDLSAREILASLRDHLLTITEANGHAVTVATVATGRAALALPSAGPFPAISLITVRDDPSEHTIPASKKQQWTRVVDIEAMIRESENWDSELDVLWDAIRKSLTQYTIHPLFWTSVEFFQPETTIEGSGALCSLKFQISFLYRITFR